MKDKTAIRKMLSGLALFESFSPKELETLVGLFSQETRLKGETICKVGDEADNFYLVFSGELEVYLEDGGERRLLNRMGPGEFFGELALVLNEKRTANVAVSHRAELLVMDRETFNNFFLRHAKAMEYFARAICQRLASATSGEVKEKMAKVVSVASLPGTKGKSMVAAALAGLLGEYSGQNVLLVSVRSDAALTVQPRTGNSKLRAELRALKPQLTELRIAVRPDISRADCSEAFSNVIAKLSDDFPVQVFDLGAEPAALIDSLGDFTDVLVAIAIHAQGGIPVIPHVTSYRVLNLYNKGAETVDINHCEPFVVPPDDALAGLDPVALFGALTARPLTPGAIPLQRLARKILGKSVGLALGGGAAFGLAHLGVLKVLEDNDVPIDILVGCSMGSLIAMGYAAGVSTERLIGLAAELGTPQKLLRLAVSDATFARPGFLAGNGIGATFKPYLGKRTTFDKLLYPCRVVATDLENGERVELDSGELVPAFSASCSVPMVISPAKHKGRVLMDGGCCDPVPAETVRHMGADICIAINVVPPMKKGVENGLTRAYKAVNQFNPLAFITDTRDLPSIIDVTLSAIQTLQYELGNFKAISADVRINPEMSDFTWVDFGEHKEIIARGAAATEEALVKIRRALAA